jgi:type I restriction enzyme M protein
LAAYEYVLRLNPKLRASSREHLRTRAIRGVELVPEVARLATMNLLLHGISGEKNDELPITVADSLRAPPDERVDVVLTNPPFGVKSSITYTTTEKRTRRTSDDLTLTRSDFWVETANKQLNFLQHIVSLLKPGGRAAVVLPDNVLFEAGVAATIRRKLMETCDVHTILRLPAGLFYAQGVKANVVFFDKLRRQASSAGTCWVYDLRSDNRFTLKTRPLQASDLKEFVELYRPGERDRRTKDARTDRWRAFSQRAIVQSENCRLDLQWNTDESVQPAASVARLDDIANQIAGDLQRALEHISRIVGSK